MEVTTIAGGPNDRNSIESPFNHPQGISMNSKGNILVADTGNDSIKCVSPADGNVTILIDEETLNRPSAAIEDFHGKLIVSDTGNHVIRRFSPDMSKVIIAGVLGTTGF